MATVLESAMAYNEGDDSVEIHVQIPLALLSSSCSLDVEGGGGLPAKTWLKAGANLLLIIAAGVVCLALIGGGGYAAMNILF